MNARLRVVVADDERPARSFLVSLLRSFEDVAVVGEAASGKDAVAIIKWKEILDFLEQATDRCEDVANVLEGVVVKHA